MSLNLTDIGLSQEELQDRVVDTMATKLLKSLACDDDGNETYASSSLEKQLKELVKKRIDEAIDRTAQTHILPRVDELISTFVLQKTNSWGEPLPDQPPMSFTEYMVKRAEEYMQEKVNAQGKTKAEDGYSWNGTQTRLTHAIHHHLQYEISTAMKNVIGDANSQIAKALHATCKMKIAEIGQQLRVTVDTGR